MSYQNRYGGAANPFDQRDAPASQPYASAPSQYNRNQYNAPAMGRDDYDGGHEMEPLTGNSGQYGRQQDSTAILDECNNIATAINGIEGPNGAVDQLWKTQKSVLNDPQNRGFSQVDQEISNIMGTYRELVARVAAMKRKPESQKYPRQIERVERQLKSAIQRFQTTDANLNKEQRDAMARQYRSVRPEASPQEIEEAVDSGNTQIYAQAIMQSNRSGQANSVLSAVKSRHEEIQKITRQMEELGQLFQQMEEMVVQQEAAVTNIEMKGEEVVENMDGGNKQIGVAIQSARNARKWKWWCLGICVLIIVIIVIVILIYKFVIQNNSTTVVNKTGSKRFVLPSFSENLVLPRMDRAVIASKAWIPEKRAITFKA